MRFDMNSFIVRLCAMAVATFLIGQRPGVAAADQDDLRQDPEVVSLLKFVSDATTLDGMFYSVRDYCLPHVTALVTGPAERAWKTRMGPLLEGRDKAMERYAEILRQRGLNDLTQPQLRQAIEDMFERAKMGNKLLSKVAAHPDKTWSCGNALGAMNSSSFAFERVAPESYAYWARTFRP